MTVASWIQDFGVAKVGQAGHGVASWLATHDPDTASQVDIDNLHDEFNRLGQKLSEAEAADKRAADEVTRLETVLARDKQAAQALGRAIQGLAADSPQAPTLNNELNNVINTIQQIGGPNGDGMEAGTLFAARQTHANTESIKHQLEQLHAGAAATLQHSEQTRQQAKADMELAKLAEQQARQQQAQAEELAGIRSNLAANSGGVALKAMQEQAAKSQQRARAMVLNAQALSASGPASTDDIVNRVLGGGTAATPSALERLAALTGQPQQPAA